MSTISPATSETKTALEDTVHWLLSDKLSSASMPIATQKYLTNANLLVYLTVVSTAETNAPRMKMQVLQRVEGGVHETGYQLYGDHRLEKYENDMIFGSQPPAGADGSANEPVSEDEAKVLLELLRSLPEARQPL